MFTRSLLAVASFLFVAAAAVAAPPWRPHQTDENGIPVITNPGVPRDGERVVQASEQWRFGADEENDPLLGLVTSAVTDDEGNAYLLDGNLSLIHVIAPDGTLLRTIGGEGDGPGEFRNSSEIVFMPGGDLGIMEMMPGRIVVMDRNGEPRDSFEPAGDGGRQMMLPQHMAADADGVLLGFVSTSFGQDEIVTRHVLGRYDADGGLVAEVLVKEDRQDAGESVSLSLGGGDDDFTRNWVQADDGRLVVFGKAFEYELQVFGPDGAPERVIRRDYETLRRSDEELAAARRSAEEMSARAAGVEIAIEERARDISAVVARDDGTLWVENSRGDRACPEGSLGVFDVFDADGLYVNTLRVDGVEYDRARDSYILDGDRLYIVREAQMVPPRTSTAGGGNGGMMMMMVSGGTPDPEDDQESGPLEVVCYRLAD
jgi:hypothetical protein